MGTVVYQQGFQSYLESQLNESRALKLRLSSPNPHFSHPFGLALKSHSLDSEGPLTNKPAASSDTESSGWSFLQSLSSLSKTTSSEKEKTYNVQHLSDQSLALCTENLGSESGSDVTDVEDLFSLDVQSKNPKETKTETNRKENVSPSDLPPPLTTMRGSECIQMRPHREDGRLVMTATKAPPRNRFFQADRSNGRLRLSIFTNSYQFEETEEYEVEEDDEVMGMEKVQRSKRYL